uniref:Uncharacterized protein n=1 Tax=Romanomermis culicivorax TaxID=13658 RepID=A0A915IUV5_ROMCU
MAKPSKKTPNRAAATVGNYGELAPSPTILKQVDQPAKKQAKSKRDVNASKKAKTKRTTEKSKKSKKAPKPLEPGLYVTNIPKDLKLTKKAAKFAGRKTLPSLPTIERSREKTGGLKKSGLGAKKAKVSAEKSRKRASIERDRSKKPASLNRDRSKKPATTDKSAKSKKSKKTKTVSKFLHLTTMEDSSMPKCSKIIGDITAI